MDPREMHILSVCIRNRKYFIWTSN